MKLPFLLALLGSSAVLAYDPSPQFKEGICVLCQDAPYGKANRKHTFLAIDRSGRTLTDDVSFLSFLARNETLSEHEVKLNNGFNYRTMLGKLMPDKGKRADENEQYQPAGIFEYVIFRQGAKMGLKRRADQQVVIKPEYDELVGHRMWRREGWLQPHPVVNCAGIKRKGKWGLFDLKTRKVVVPAEYDSIEPTGDHISVALQGDKWCYVSRESGALVAGGFISAFPFSDGKAIAFRTADTALVIDETGAEISQFQCKAPLDPRERWNWLMSGELVFHGNRVVVRRDEKYGILDSNGKEVQPFVFDKIGNYNDGAFRDGMVRFVQGGKVGFFDSAGKIAVPPSWNDSGVFSEGLAYVVAGDRWGFIDKTGSVIIGPVKFPTLSQKR